LSELAVEPVGERWRDGRSGRTLPVAQQRRQRVLRRRPGICYRYRIWIWYRIWICYWIGDALLVLDRFRSGASLGLARCRNGARRFPHVRRLVPGEVHDLDVPASFRFKSEDEAGVLEVLQEPVHIDLVVGKDFDLEADRIVDEPSFAVGDAP